MRCPTAVVVLAALAILLSALWSGGHSAAQKGGGTDLSVQLDGYWIANPETVRIQSSRDDGPYFDALVQFTPPEWGIAADVDIPDGAIVGDSWLGANIGPFENLPCNLQTNLNVQWVEATTNTAGSFTYNPAIDPLIYEPNWTGYDIMGSGLERAVEEYPDFLNTMFPAITPRARYYAHVNTGAGESVYQYLIFEPGTALPDLPAFDPGDGYPALLIIDDPTAPPEPGRTWDICTPWQGNFNFWPYSGDNGDTAANENGYIVRTNPGGDGWYPFRAFERERPDADGDGIENQTDTCPYDPNWDEDPRDGSGPDGDGLDSACDPTPDESTIWDPTNDEDGAAGACGDTVDNGPDGLTDIEDPDCHDPWPDPWPSGDIDDDGYANRQDNCPLDANGTAGDNQADDDNDGIGDACDLNLGSVDGPGQENWLEYWVEVTGDSDLDGWSDAFENIVGSNPWEATSYPEHLMADPGTCSDGVDNDLDGLVDSYDPGCDVDDDGVVNAFDACPDNPEDWDGFQDADGCPDDDNDMDGIPDSDEDWTESGVWCANIPEDFDAFQDWDGCPDPDNDQDGFPDVTDDCPGTDWTAGPDGVADSGDEPLVNGVPIQTREDRDGVLDTDGCHDSPGDDYDGDGFDDELEFFSIGTDPASACAATSTPNDEDPDPLPPDADDDQDIDIGDVINLFLGKILDPPAYVPRSDFDGDGDIDIGDVIKGFSESIFTSCA